MRTLPALVIVFLFAVSFAAHADEIDDAQALLGTERHAEGVARLKKEIAALEKKAVDADAVRRSGVGWFFLEEDAKAMAAFRRTIQLAPKNAKGYYWLAILQQYSDLEEAEKTMARAAELAVKKMIYFFHLAEIQRFQEKSEEALATYRKVIALDDGHAEAHLHIGTLLQRKGESAEALKYYERAAALDGSLVHAHYNAGLLRYLSGEFDLALAHLQAGARQAPDDFEMHKKWIQALYALARYDEAKKVRARLLEIEEGMEEKPESFCFDQFSFDDKRVMAFERFDTGEDLFYLYVFVVLDKDEKTLLRVNLETSRVVQELGGHWLLGLTENDGTHATLPPHWKQLPPYPELKKQVILAAQGKLSPPVTVKRENE